MSFAVTYLEKQKTLAMMHMSFHSVRLSFLIKHCRIFGNYVKTELH